MSGPVEMWQQAAGNVDRPHAAIAEEQWDAPTPCTDWKVRDLVEHVVGGQAFFGGGRGSTAGAGDGWPAVRSGMDAALSDPSALEGNAVLPGLGSMPKQQVIGATSTGVNARVPEVKPGEVVGHFIAINPVTGEKKWEVPLADLPSSAGMLATGGGLVFTGKLTGEFIALDEDTGKTLWQFRTGSSVNSTAITYTHKGRQFVTVASGLGGILATRYASSKLPTGGSVWTFALMQD